MLNGNPVGILLIFLFHALTMFILCPSRLSRPKTLAVWGGMVALCSVASLAVMRASPNLSGMLVAFGMAAVAFCVTVFTLSDHSVAKTLFLFLTYLQMFMAALFLSGFLSFHLFGSDVIVIIVIRTLLQVGVLLLCMLLHKRFSAVSPLIPKGWWPLDLLALLLLSTFSVLTLHAFSDFSRWLESLFIFFMIVVLTGVYWVFFHTIFYMSAAAKAQQAEIQSLFLGRQVEAMQASVEEARRVRHDARHHNLVIAEYVKKGEYAALLAYLDEYEHEAERKHPMRLCGNMTVDNVLTAYARKAEQRGIATRFDVSVEQSVGVSEVDLVAILANLMENAINGSLASDSPQPAIDVYIAHKANKLVIRLSNPCSAGVRFENGLPRGADRDGVGISSVLSSVKAYRGEADFHCAHGVFTCCILLNLPR